jgi:long-chain acyl-CoA synthetase
MTTSRPPSTVLEAFAARRAAGPDLPAVHYYGRRISRAELDDLSDAMAHHLTGAGVGPEDRVAVSLQNTPAFAVLLLATWKLGAVFVPVNPMLRPGELAALVQDCEPKVLAAHPDMSPVVRTAVEGVAAPPALVWSDPSDLAGDLTAPWGEREPLPYEGTALLAALASYRGRPLAAHAPSPDDLALLVYTSGTTGPSKGAMLSHANIGYHASVTPEWLGLDDSDAILTIAPFFHITGLGMHLALGLGSGMALVMTYRFDPARVLGLIESYSPRFTVGTITAFISLAERAAESEEGRKALASMSSVVSGGAAVPAAVVDRYESDFGVYIRNGYGLTETASACVVVPPGERAPVDPGSGAVSVGRPLPGVTVSVLVDDGSEAPPGVGGEIVLRGPQVGSGYRNRPDETANTFGPDGLRTGDIGMVDEDGWLYLVDRKKDLIVVSGYKVWPRDVEDVLYRHPAVAEAAVIGVPDDYRGESVQAYVALRPGHDATPEDLNRHCREYLSAYKCPRRYEIVPTLPKSASGKILRRMLREDH